MAAGQVNEASFLPTGFSGEENATKVLSLLSELLSAKNGPTVHTRAGPMPKPTGMPKARSPFPVGVGNRADDSSARHILDLLQGMQLPEDNPNTSKATTLEYRGQWQPKPNGAETGHGVVPEDWAIELASESDRALASFGWAGGAQLCLSNAFQQASEMEAQAQDLIDSGVCEEDDAAVQCIRTIAKATEEREALMRRQWCDIDFQEGEDANKELLRNLERDFAGQLASTASRQISEEEQRKRRRPKAQKYTGDTEADSDRMTSASSTSAPWYNIKVFGGTKPGKVYLSAEATGNGIDLCGHDDESGRQRWYIVPGGSDGTGNGKAAWYNLRLVGGTMHGRRFLSRGLDGRIDLCERDDASGRQRWHLVRGSDGSWVNIRAAAGDPGIGIAAEIEAAARDKCLAGDASGKVSLGLDDSSGRHRWLIPDWAGLTDKAKQPDGTSQRTSAKTEDDVLSIAVQSGAKEALSLQDLSQEQMNRVLNNNRNLGVAIDLVGVYLKNYEIDKADRLCARIQPLVRERGGMWLFKFLNFFSTVRMKQSRYQEALDMYKEYETLIGYTPEEAWELYDTVYRNYGWIYTSLHDYQKALEYFEKAVQVKRRKGIQPHWFDQWDLGKTHARISLQGGRPENLEMALRLIKEGLDMHKRAEPKDVIMRCKMLNSAGECATILGDYTDGKQAAKTWYAEAEMLHQESVGLYMKVLGPGKPLTGWAMEDLAGVLQRLDKHQEATEMLHGALRVECSKDIIKLSAMARLLDSVLEVHRATGDREGLADCQDAINIGLANLQKRRIDKTEAVSYAGLLQKIADLLLAHSIDNREGAVSLLEEAIACLRNEGAHHAEGISNFGKKPGVEAASLERDSFDIPKAAQQRLEDVNGPELLDGLEHKLKLLREVHSCMESWTPEACEGKTAPAASDQTLQEREQEQEQSSQDKLEAAEPEVLTFELPPQSEDVLRNAGEALKAERWPVGMPCPVHFEVVDDFCQVD